MWGVHATEFRGPVGFSQTPNPPVPVERCRHFIIHDIFRTIIFRTYYRSSRVASRIAGNVFWRNNFSGDFACCVGHIHFAV